VPPRQRHHAHHGAARSTERLRRTDRLVPHFRQLPVET
jgi:hypothetical protein